MEMDQKAMTTGRPASVFQQARMVAAFRAKLVARHGKVYADRFAEHTSIGFDEHGRPRFVPREHQPVPPAVAEKLAAMDRQREGWR